MKNLKNIIFWAGIFITILTYIFVRPLSNLDEIWNFNIARCISNGLVPYKDISMVATPLLSFITAIFLKIFGTEMFITRILAAILAILNLILVYRICKKLEISKTITSILILIITFILRDYFCLDYNFFVLAIGLAIILLEIRNVKNEKSTIATQIFIGILGGLSFCTKQSIGLLICFIIVINQLFFIKNKPDIKKLLKPILFRVIGIIIPIIAFIIYLLCNNAFMEFLDYCIFGIKTFSNNIAYTSLVQSKDRLIKILSIFIPIILIASVIINIVTKCLKKENKTFYLLNIYCLPIFAIVYPIADNIHFLIGIIPALILLTYSIMWIVKRYIKLPAKYILEFLEITSMIGLILFTIYVEFKNLETLGDLSKYTTLNNFKYIHVSQSLNDSIQEIDNYINSSDKKVYILDACAAVYMIPIDRYNKNYDMFNKGNLGSGGEGAQIENIKNEDAKYLIMSDENNRNWQTPESVVAYIKENLNKIGTIGEYDIYENKITNEESLNTETPQSSTTENTTIENSAPQAPENEETQSTIPQDNAQ
ncbi:MAG: glycosyltransferase family 39 protein [Clostridia bacterium]|nr:glycosyltransferase family 39 protein [Clostridia bacterium]